MTYIKKMNYLIDIQQLFFKDYGANIYGNWVFNTVGMSSFNEKSVCWYDVFF